MTELLTLHKRCFILASVLLSALLPASAFATDRRRGRITVVDRLGRRRGGHGAGPRYLYVLFAPEMELGDNARLCGEHLGTLSGQLRQVHQFDGKPKTAVAARGCRFQKKQSSHPQVARSPHSHFVTAAYALFFTASCSMGFNSPF